MSALRNILRRSLPAPALDAARGLRDRLQVLESDTRRRLPARLGGPLGPRAHVRSLTSDDAGAYLGLRGDEGWSHARLRAALASDAGICMGAWLGSRLVAVGWCRPLPGLLGVDDWCFVSDFVDPRYRRRGLARALHRARLSDAARRGHSRVLAYTDARNGPSIAALRAVGFSGLDDPPMHGALRAHQRASGLPRAQPLIFHRATGA